MTGVSYAKLWGGALSPTSRQHAYKSAVLALGLSSCPPNPQAGAHHGAIIAIPTAVRRTMHFGGRARAIFMRGRRDGIRHWRPGHFVQRGARRRRAYIKRQAYWLMTVYSTFFPDVRVVSH